MAATTERTKERWVYAGRRLNAKRQVIHAWLDPNGDTVHFKKVPGGSIGSVYEVEVEREGERITVYGQASYLEASTTVGEETVAGWRAEDAAARHDLEQAREEKRAAADSEVEEALEVLRRHFKACRNYSAKWSFAQYVAAEVARPPKED